MSDPQRNFSAASVIERWSLPLVEGNVIGRPVDERKAAAAAEAIARVAREQSEARGYEAGMAKAKTEMQGRIAELEAHVKRLDSVLQFIARPLQELDAEVEKTLLQLTLAVGKQLARRELRIDPAQVIAIIRESLQELPTAAREIRVHLHPEDAAIVRERLTAPSNERAWTIVEDPAMSRGGCVVKTETSRIDARLESRINTVIANALGDERSPDRTDTPVGGGGIVTAADLNTARASIWSSKLERHVRKVELTPAPPVEGSLTRMVGLTLEAIGCQASMGDTCDVIAGDGSRVESEVVGFSGERLYLMPTGDAHGLGPNARVIPRPGAGTVPVGPQLLGRIIDGAANPLDNLGPLECETRVRLSGKPINPLARQPISEPLDVGVRTINSMLTIGRGQRIGLFAGSGVGKSVLLGMMARYTSADVIVVGLIGERGREVKEFVERILGPKDRTRAVVVATPADHPPLMRLHGAWLCTAIAEYFRDQGRSVLLLMDSLTRFAQAQREIGLAIGEAPATKGYPPSVFAKLPQLVERAGNGVEGGGSITAFYTVLTEGDDNQDPIADSARAILDGHIVLSRRIAESGQYPAIDVEASISRVMQEIAKPDQIQAARQFRQTLSTYQQNRDLISIGAYQPGTDPRIDNAITLWPRMQRFLQQDMRERVDFAASLSALKAVLADTEPAKTK